MKQFLKYWSVILLLTCLTTFLTNAKIHNVNISSDNGNLTQYLRDRCKTVNRNDTIIVNFGKGEFIINGTIEFKCNVILKGESRNLSTIILDKGNDRSGFKAFTDGAFLKFYGVIEQPISVDISEISIKLKDHKGLWWKDYHCHAIKVYHAKHVNIHHMDSYMKNALITNIDLRVCSNVYVTDCIISNYNNCLEGGNLWIRGEMHNINIKHNKFYKYGNDEVIGLFSNIINLNGNIRGNAFYTDVFIEENEIFYGYNGTDKDQTITNHTLLTIEAEDSKDKWVTTMHNIHVNNNKFHINDQCMRCILVKFPEGNIHNGIYFKGNQFINENLNSDKKYYRQDIEINDHSTKQDTIHLINNIVTNRNPVVNPYNTVGYSFLLLQGGNVDMINNQIVNHVTMDPFSNRETGVQLVWCGEYGGTITMRDNICKGIKCISTVGSGNGTKQFTLKAFNNYFSGDTRVYCHKVERLNLNFTSNTLVSNSTNFFLQEFASKGSVIFNNNDVTITTKDGRFMTHWSNASTDAMKFELLEVKNNVFRGVKGEQDMFKKITNVKKRRLSSNKYVK